MAAGAERVDAAQVPGRLGRTRLLWAGGALLAIGAVLRLWHVFTDPLWLDEAYSAYAADHGLWFLWHVVPRYETHPPFYYTLLWSWTKLFGDGLVALRMPGLLAGFATIGLMPPAARALARLAGLDRRATAVTMLAAFGFACTSLMLTQMARNVRPYPIMILVYLGAIWALLALARRGAGRLPLGGRACAAYFLCLALMLWLHNLGVLYAAALEVGLLAAVARPGLTQRDLVWLAGGHLIVLVLWLPALAILLDQAHGWVGNTWLKLDPAVLPARLLELYGAANEAAALATLLLAGGAVVLLRGAGQERTAVLLLATAILPVFLSLAISVVAAPVFILRTMTPVAVPTLLLAALGVSAWMRGRAPPLGIGAAILIGIIAIEGNIWLRWTGPSERWHDVVRWIAPRLHAGDVILAYPNEAALPFGYAARDEHLVLPVRPVPTAVPSVGVGGWYPTGSRGVVSLPHEALAAIARSPGVRAAPTVWLLRMAPGTYDIGDDFLRVLRRDRRIVGRWRERSIDLIGLAPGAKLSRPAAPAGAGAAR